jgi:hypothetical protein
MCRSTNGFITDKRFKNEQNSKELFQTVHTSFLAQPKIKTEKVVNVRRSFNQSLLVKEVLKKGS